MIQNQKLRLASFDFLRRIVHDKGLKIHRFFFNNEYVKISNPQKASIE